MKTMIFSLVFFAFYATTFAQTPAQNKAKAMEFYKAFNGDFSQFNAANFVAADFVDYNIPSDAWAQMGADGVARFQGSLGMFKQSFPDSQWKTNMAVAEGDLVMVYGEQTGTFKADMMGMKANGKSFKINDVDIIKFNAQGKAVAHWAVQDQSVMWMQLGVSMK
jgi:predicted ester cyclase